MTTMKAIVVTKYGDVEGLVVSEVPKPTPLPHDLIIRVKAVSLNPVDTKVRKNGGDTSKLPRENLILGYDGSGIVEELGSEAKLFKVGDEVFFAGSRIRNGTNAEFIAIDERIVGRKPKNFTWEQAAAVPLTGLTAWEGIAEQLEIKPYSDNSNKTLLVVAGAGGVGSMVIVLAKKIFNLKVIATASRPETVEYVKSLGADHSIDHTKPLLEQLQALGYPTGVNYIYNCGETNQNFDDIVPAVTHFGRIVLITNGPDQTKNITQLFLKRVTITYELMFTRPHTGIEIEKQHEILEKLADLVEEGVIPDRVNKTLSLKNDIQAAHKLQESGRVIGKIALTFDL